MKYLIYQQFSGVGFCNQLFSLETAIYLANILDRKLILLIHNGLCHCGRASWDYGYFLDYFKDYKKYLPHGIDVYYKSTPKDITDKIQKAKKLYNINSRFSASAFVDKGIENNSNKNAIQQFVASRSKVILDYDELSKHEYIYTNKSNASRCFYNFYTTKQNYVIMNNICKSLTYYNEVLEQCISKIKLNGNFNAIHFRFGDRHKSSSFINQNNNTFKKKIEETIKDKKKPIYVMSDRKDNSMLKELQEKYNIIFTHEFISNIIIDTNINTDVYKFIIEKSICEKADLFLCTFGSTVSNYIQYNRFLHNKPYNLCLSKNYTINNNRCGWYGKLSSVSIGFSYFFSDNVYKSMKTNGNKFFSFVEKINIQPQKNKKIISFCLYDIKKKHCSSRRAVRNYFKGVFVNYYLSKLIYPGWTIRVYMPYKEPLSHINIIKSFKDIELILVDTNINFMSTRFLPHDDPDVDIWISRDLDSIVNWREKAAVDDWLENYPDKELHTMKDAGGHAWDILCGMFGFKNKNNSKSLLDFCLSLNENNIEHRYAFDCYVAKTFFLKNDNYIEHYKSGKKLENSKPFPPHKPIDCYLVGNIVNIENYYNKFELEKLYPQLIELRNDEINADKYMYTPWRCFKTPPLCKLIHENDDIIMTIHDNKTSGAGTFRTTNKDGKKLLAGEKVNIWWENKKYFKGYKKDDNIVIIHDNNVEYTFFKED